MPYAAKAIVQHEFDTDHLNVWLTFCLPMKRTNDPLAEPPVYDVIPPLAKWLCCVDTVTKAVSASEWQDEYTLLLTVPNIVSNPTEVFLAYAGPDPNLLTTWEKQWEPWGAILSSGLAPDITKNLYARRATVWHDEVTIVVGNTLNVYVYPTQMYNAIAYQGEPSDGDSFSHSFFLKAGTYNFYVLGVSSPSQAKLDWYIDGVKIAEGEDWYSDPTAMNVIKTTADVVITTNGYHKLTGVVNGKNDLSLDYYIALTKYWLKPATDPARE